MTICIQCALRAVVAGKDPATARFDEEPEEHLLRCHPDPLATMRERAELELKLYNMPDFQDYIAKKQAEEVKD